MLTCTSIFPVYGWIVFYCDICFRQLEENLLETVCVSPGESVGVLAGYLKDCRHYNPMTVFNMAMLTGKMQYAKLLIRVMEDETDDDDSNRRGLSTEVNPLIFIFFLY